MIAMHNVYHGFKFIEHKRGTIIFGRDRSPLCITGIAV